MPHPNRLYELLDARELAEWRAYFALEPQGELRADMRMARLCGVVAAAHGAKDFTDEDFMFKFNHGPQTVDEMKAAIMRFKEGD